MKYLLASNSLMRSITVTYVIYVRPTVNTVFIDKHYCLSVLVLCPTV